MAKVYKNDKNFLVIEMDTKEATKLGFGINTGKELNKIVCGNCNNFIENDKIYYIAAINEVMCEECLEDCIKNMNHYIDDDSLKYEITHFNVVAQNLCMFERASFTPDSKIIITI